MIVGCWCFCFQWNRSYYTAQTCFYSLSPCLSFLSTGLTGLLYSQILHWPRKLPSGSPGPRLCDNFVFIAICMFVCACVGVWKHVGRKHPDWVGWLSGKPQGSACFCLSPGITSLSHTWIFMWALGQEFKSSYLYNEHFTISPDCLLQTAVLCISQPSVTVCTWRAKISIERCLQLSSPYLGGEGL